MSSRRAFVFGVVGVGALGLGPVRAAGPSSEYDTVAADLAERFAAS